MREMKTNEVKRRMVTAARTIRPVRRETISGFCGGGLHALKAGANRAQMIVGIDAGGVAVGKRNLNCVVPYLGSGGSARSGFEHGERGRGSEGRRCSGEGFFLFPLVIAGSAGAMVAEIGKIEMRDMAVGPGDVHTRVGGDVNFYAGWFAAGT